MIKLDVKDRKLLYYLNKDGRMSNNQLAKLTELGKNTVAYRIERLKKEAIITHFSSIVNIGSLGLNTFTVLLKFNEDIYENKEIINYFKNHDNADWIVTLSGEWDIFAELVTKNHETTHKIIQEIKKHFGEKLNTYKVMFSNDTLRVEHLIEDFYKDLELEEISIKPRTNNKYKIDDTDIKIMEVLNKDSSLSYIELTKRTGLTLDVVRYRIKNLLNNEIIIKFFPEISLKKLGYTEYLYTINLKNTSQEKIDSLRNYLKLNNAITYAFTDTVEPRIIFSCAFKNNEGIDHFSRNLRKNYSEIIEKQEFQLIKEQILFNLFPKGIKTLIE